MKAYQLTREGYNKLKKEKEDLTNNKRKEIAEGLKEAKETAGDLAENAEYEYAKTEQAFIEGRIEQVNEILNNYVIIKENAHKDKVGIGSTVTVRDIGGKKNSEYQIVSSVESDPEKNRVSNESPMGKAILNKKIGDEVSFKTPGSNRRLKIVKLS